MITQHRAGQPLKPGKHLIQGIGAGFIPAILNLKVIDEVIAVSDDDALETARQLAAREGLFCGMSGGAAMAAALNLAADLESGVIVVIIPDRGDRYLSTNLFKSLCAKCPP